MPRLLMLAAVFASVWVAGCANPADDKFKVTATEAKPVEPEAPKPDESSGPAPAPASPDALVIAPEQSKIEFTGSKVTGSHNGGFKSFAGTAELATASEAPELRRVDVEIDMGSTWSDDDKLTGHLKSPDFFDVAKYPKAHFVSTEIKPGGEKGASHTVTGNLTLHGVTKSVTFPATITASPGEATIASEFALNRKDFGIVYPGKSDDLIRDEVVIRLDVKAKKKA